MKQLLWIVALLLLTGGHAAAQEAQVPLDRAGRVEAVDAGLARRLGLFLDEYPGFVEARLFQAADSTFALEVTLRRDGRLVRERRPMTADEVRVLRERIGTLAAERAPAVGLNQEGRNLLLGQTALLGLGFYGPAMIGITEANGSAVLGTYMLTAGASFFLPFALTQNQPVTYGMAHLSRYGATRGVLHGALLHNLLAGSDGDERVMLTTMLVTSVGEAVAGYRWARGEEMSAGRAATIAGIGDLGLIWGAATGGLIEAEDRLASALALAGSAAGIYGGARLASARDFTWGDASLLYTAGLLGAYSGLAVGTLATSDDHDGQIPAALIMAGSGFAAYSADRLLRGKDFTVGQSSLVQLGTLAGGLTGLGLAAMAGSEDEEGYLVASALGAVGGFGLTYSAFAGEAASRRGEALSSLKVRLTPTALLAPALRGATEEGRLRLPLASVEYRF